MVKYDMVKHDWLIYQRDFEALDKTACKKKEAKIGFLKDSEKKNYETTPKNFVSKQPNNKLFSYSNKTFFFNVKSHIWTLDKTVE